MLAYIVPMPLDKDGRGPAAGNEIVKTVYEIWDDDFNTLSTHDTEEEARQALKALR